jgi:pyrroline-5-carboxylate reductase
MDNPSKIIMRIKIMERKENIGIIGCGHLGLAFAIKLRENTPNKILLSYSGRLSTLQRIKSVGLEQNISSNESIVENCSIIFLFIRPQLPAALQKE